VSAGTSLRETKQSVGTKNLELHFEFGQEVQSHSRGSDDSSLRKTNLRRLRVGDEIVANPNSRKTGVYPAKDLVVPVEEDFESWFLLRMLQSGSMPPTPAPSSQIPATGSPTRAPSTTDAPNNIEAPTTTSPTRAPSTTDAPNNIEAPTTTSPTRAPSTTDAPNNIEAPTTTSPTRAPTTPLPTISPTNPPTIVPTICSGLTDDDRTTAIRAIVVSISPGSIIEEGSSTPQSQAFNWVVNVDQNCPGSDEDNTSIEQRYILAVLYYSTNGADWTDSGAFLSVNLTECLWRIPDPASGDGIFCTDNGTVVNRIAIDDNNLNGTLPSELGSLPSLRALLLDSNENIQGTIPESFKELSNLTFLDLDNNTLSGTIPEFLYGLSALLAVDLNYNDFSGTISSQISQLSNLNFLDLSDNFFNGTIPDVINIMTSLNQLALYENELTGTIPDISSLAELKELFLYGNFLNGTLPSFQNLVNLVELDLGNNIITGPIPDISNLAALEDFFLYENILTGPLPSFQNLGQLVELDLSDNEFTGTIPATIGSLPNLTSLRVHKNVLIGTMPVQICLLTSPPPPLLEDLTADCLGIPPPVECDCCTECF